MRAAPIPTGIAERACHTEPVIEIVGTKAVFQLAQEMESSN